MTIIEDWHRVFAWTPVQVDAYHVDEVRNGHTSFTVWLQWVETCVQE